jgi:hypothetical protein
MKTSQLTTLLSCSELAREKMWARIHLIPLLQAEEDRDQVRRYWADQKREKELLGDNTKVYNSDRCDFPLTMDWVESNGLLTVKQIRATDICCFPGTFEINGVNISMGDEENALEWNWNLVYICLLTCSIR